MYLGVEVIKTGRGSVVAYNGDGHLLTIGPTRSGKSRRLLVPNLLYETKRSFLVVDIKGELAAITAGHRARKGSRVVALDPFGVLARRGVTVPIARFNPLDALDPDSDDFVDDAMNVAEALVQVSPGAHEPHWAESAQDFVAAHIMQIRDVYGIDANLGIVRREVSRGAQELEILVRDMFSKSRKDAIRNKFNKFSDSTDNKEIASILSTAQTQTRFLDSPPIVANLEKTTIDFSVMKSEPTTVYLVLPPDRLLTHAKWLRLIISSAMRSMQRTLKLKDRPDVVFVLDEFPQLGRLQSIETAVSLNAGFGVKVWIAVQHLGQLKEQYGDNWETFLSAGCVTAFSPRDVFTRDHLTRLIGTGSKSIRSVSYGSQGATNVTENIQKDDLVSPHEWRAMVLGEHWAFIPTDSGQRIKRLFSDDFTRLPEVINGTIRPDPV